MSVQSPTQTFDCAYCEDEYTHGVKGSFCGIECWYRHKGENILSQIQTDHTYCSSCFALRKEIDKPPAEFKRRLKITNGPESGESLQGFQYYTPNVEKADGFVYCKCGNIDHHAEVTELRDISLKDVLVNLWGLLVDYYEKGQLGEQKPDRSVLFNTLKESDLDFAYAIGKSAFHG